MEHKYFKTGKQTGSFIQKAIMEGLTQVEPVGVRRELGRLQKQSDGHIRLLQPTGEDSGERFLSVFGLELAFERSKDTVFKRKR